MNKRYIYEEQDDGYYFIKDTIKNNYLNVVTNVELLNKLTNNQNQKAIECLKEVKECFLSGVLMFYTDSDLTEREQDKILEHYEEDKLILADIIDNKIKELEEN